MVFGEISVYIGLEHCLMPGRAVMMLDLESARVVMALLEMKGG
jgi:hypothetical protein